MNTFRFAYFVKIPANFLVFALVLTACGQHPAETTQEPPEDGFSRYPETNPAQEQAPDVGPNPWVSGLPGDPSEGGALDGQSGGDGNSPGTSGADAEPNIDPDLDSDGSPQGTVSVAPGNAGQDGRDSEIDEDQQVEPALLQRRFVRYLEGEGTDKLLGLFGESGISPVECRVEIYSNGGTEPWRSIPLPHEFPHDGNLTLCSLPEKHPECTASISGSLYNGNDALVLVCGDKLMDSIGRVGEDPGVAWTSADKTLRTEGQDLARCGDEPRRDPFAPFDLFGAWVRVENGESPEEARLKCEQLGAPEGGAGAPAL